RGNPELQSAALPDGESVRTIVRADDVAIAVEDLALFGTDLLGQPATSVTVRDEADVVAIRLLRDAQTALRSLSAHERLRRRLSQREVRVGQLLCGEHAEHIRLVLRVVR